jgi:helix-turn-helix protein
VNLTRALSTLPTLDDIARDPAQTCALSPKMRSELIVRASAIIALLAAPMIAEPSSPPAPEPDDTMLTVEEAAKLIRRDRRWIWRHKKTLPFVKQISGKSLLVSKRGLERWLASRRLNT